jgi:hypothetical protein
VESPAAVRAVVMDERRMSSSGQKGAALWRMTLAFTTSGVMKLWKAEGVLQNARRVGVRQVE